MSFTTKREFLEHAQRVYGLSWDVVVAILKNAGHSGWDSEQVNVYLSTLTDYQVKKQAEERLLHDAEQERLSVALSIMGEKWGLSVEEVQALRRKHSWIVLDQNCWEEYQGTMRLLFDMRQHVSHAKAYNDRIQRLTELRNTLTIEVHPGGWKYVGSQEALEALYELDEIARKANRARSRYRLQPIV